MAGNKVGVGKGNGSAGAYFYTAPLGTALPTDAKTALPKEYTAIALISEDGVTFSIESDVTNHHDWAGNTVYTSESNRTETAQMSLIETNIAAMKEAYGDSAVSGTESKFTVDHKALERTAKVYVWEVLLSDTQIKRIVAPNGKVSTLDDIEYVPGELAKYPVTVTCLNGDEGYSVREFVEDVSTTASTGKSGS